MQLHFLRAEVPLTKEFHRQDDGTIEKTSYPFVKNFWSIDHEVHDIHEFKEALEFHANEKHCLLKGKLNRELHGESRAGSTDNILDKTRWVVFDIDGLPGVETPEAFVALLPDAFQNVSYIVQLSASHGLDNREGLRCHVYFMLTEAVLPTQIKGWTKEFNLSTPGLHEHTELSANAVTLKYPLDITVGQNDKLIYIAPPICVGLEDPYAGERIRLVEKELGRVDFNFPFDAALTHDMEKQRVGNLRVERGLRRKTPKYRDVGGENILTNPEIGSVTGEKEQNGFIRLNINGGDSWGYYYNPEKPRFLRNFKGEPTVILADFLPEYWRQIQQRLQREGDPNAERMIIFNDPVADTYFAGVFDPVNNRHEINAVKSKDKLRDFAALHGHDLPDPVPNFTREFRPDLETIYDERNRFINLYQPSELWKQARRNEEAKVPFQIDRILRSICVDQETYDSFLNWVACLVQLRTKIGTAWIFQGVQGTGKGLFVHHVMAPILGGEYVVATQLNSFKDQFNAHFETALLINIDESSIENVVNGLSHVVNTIKQMITEENVSIRAMRQNSYKVKTFCNFVLTTNENDPITIDENDRRYHVAPRQEKPIDFTTEDMVQLQGELAEFADFLYTYDADLTRARKPELNAAKREAILSSRNSVDELVMRVKTGDLAWLARELCDGMIGDRIDYYTQACKVIEDWLDDAIKGEQTLVRITHFGPVYAYISGRSPNPGRMKKMLGKKHMTLPRATTWNLTPFEAQDMRKELATARKQVMS